MKNVVPKGIVRLILIGGALGVLATTSSSAQESSFNTGYGTKSQKKKKSSLDQMRQKMRRILFPPNH